MWKWSSWCHLVRRGAVFSSSHSNLEKCQGCISSLVAASATSLRRCNATASPLSSLCASTRAVSSTQPDPSATSAAPSSSPHPPGSRREVKRLRLRTPEIMTHESLSYAMCPICGGTFHMRNMLVHIRAIHKDADMVYWAQQCNARLALYERVIGIPLAPSDSTLTPLDAAMKASMDPLFFADNTSGAPLISQEAFRAFLPTITANGSYMCNWCTVKHAPFPTRDAFLLHVAKDHPTLDFDVVESLVQLPASTSPPAGGATATAATVEESESSESSPAQSKRTLWEPPQDPSIEGYAAQIVDTDYSGPTRRIPGVKTVLQSNVAAVKLAPRQYSLSVARVESVARDPAALGTVSSAAASSSATATDGHDIDLATTAEANKLFFREHHFPCELCLKVFVSEMNLLQHLESKHSPPPLTPSKAEGNPASVQADTKTMPLVQAPVSAVSTTPLPAAANAEKTSDAPTTICVNCDLCVNDNKTYTLPSALFAHIRFRHRSVDTIYEAERMMREQRNRTVYRCSQCSLVCADQAALHNHMWDKHSMVNEEAVEVPLNSVEPPPTENATTTAAAAARDSIAAKYVSSTLPSFSMAKRWWCDECGCGFRTPKALSAHRQGKHTAVTELFPCPACRRVFHDAFTLEDHVKAMHRSMKLADINLPTSTICPHCNRGFLGYEALHDHCVKHHNKDPRSPVRQFAKPGKPTAIAGGAAETTVGGTDATVTAAGGGGGASSEIAGVPKPRKVSRRKKATTADA